MTLKTSKELEKTHNCDDEYEGLDYIDPEELKAEAIKWVKKLKFDDEEGVWNIFMEFHNITEEDLK